MIDDDQDAMGQSHNRFLVPHALAQSLVIGSQKGALAACSGVGGFNEGLAQPSVPFARFGAEPFVRYSTWRLDTGPSRKRDGLHQETDPSEVPVRLRQFRRCAH